MFTDNKALAYNLCEFNYGVDFVKMNSLFFSYEVNVCLFGQNCNKLNKWYNDIEKHILHGDNSPHAWIVFRDDERTRMSHTVYNIKKTNDKISLNIYLHNTTNTYVIHQATLICNLIKSNHYSYKLDLLDVDSQVSAYWKSTPIYLFKLNIL